jgi:Leucine-rich repeat (LRR) protein
LDQLPIDSLLLGDGVNTPASQAIATLQSLPGLRRLNFYCKSITDADLALLASLTQLEELHFEGLELPDDLLSQLKAFAFLRSITFALRPKGHPPETQAKIKALLPGVELKFVQ